MSRRATQFLIAITLLVGIPSRFALLDADPDVTLTTSNAFFGDEGRNAGNASAHYLRGTWSAPPDHITMMPVVPAVQRIFYGAFGHHLWVPRAATAMFAVAWVLLLALFTWYAVPPRARPAATLTVLLLAFSNHYLFVYGRLALFDVPGAAAALLVLLVFLSIQQRQAPRTPARHWALLGIVLTLAILTRTHAVACYSAIGIFLFLQTVQQRRLDTAPWARWLVTGLGVALAVWTILWVVRLWTGVPRGFPYEDVSLQVSLSLPVLVKRYLTLAINPLVLANLLLYVIAAAGIGRTLWGVWARRDVPLGDLVMSSYFLAVCLMHGLFAQQPPRWMLPTLTPALYFASTLVFRRAPPVGSGDTPPSPRWALLGLVMVANLWNVVSLGLYVANPRYSWREVAGQIAHDIALDAARTGVADRTAYGYVARNSSSPAGPQGNFACLATMRVPPIISYRNPPPIAPRLG